MTARSVAAAFAVLAAILVVTGGGGRAPWSACAWEASALLAFGVACLSHTSFRRPWSALAFASTGLAGWIVLSAATGIHRSSGAQQAAAWIAAMALASAIALLADKQAWPLIGDPGSAVARIALVASGIAFTVVAAGQLGYPLGGRAGATLPEGDSVRPLGTFADPNHLTAFLVLAMAVHCRWVGLRQSARWHALLSVTLGLAALATGSRLAAGAVVAVAFAEIIRRGRAALLVRSRRAGIAAAIVVVVAGSALAWTLATRRGEADAWTRPRIWSAASRALVDRPLTGLGPAGFQHAWQPYNFPVERGLSRFEKLVTTPHAEWLRLPIELGFPGALLGLTVVLLFLRRLRHPVEALPLAAGLLPFVAVHDAFHSPATAAWTCAAAGLLLAAAPAREELAVRGSSAPRRGMLLAASVLVALGLGWRIRAARSEALWLRDDSPTALGRALTLDAANPDLLRALASLLSATGPGHEIRDLQADAVLEEAERLAPRDPRPVLERARLLRRGAQRSFPDEGTRAGMLETYGRAVALAPTDAFIRVEAAAAALTLSDPVAASRLAGEALALEPAMVRAQAIHCLALAEQGSPDAEAARLDLERSLAASRLPGPRTDYERDLIACEDDLVAQALAQP